MNVQTQRFGEIDVPEHAVIQFPDGILGFPQLRQGCLLPYRPDSPGPPDSGPQLDSGLRWLQSLDDPSLLFLTVEPYLIFPDYDVELSDADAAALQLESADHAAVLTLITISQPTRARRDTASASRASASRAPASRAPALRASASRASASRATASRAPASRAPALRASASRASASRAPALRAAVTTNLLAPIVINTRARRARQVILDSDRYLTKHIIGAQIEEDLNAGADPKTR